MVMVNISNGVKRVIELPRTWHVSASYTKPSGNVAGRSNRYYPRPRGSRATTSASAPAAGPFRKPYIMGEIERELEQRVGGKQSSNCMTPWKRLGRTSRNRGD